MVNNLVIGSDGFVGAPFCEYLESKGEKVIRFDIKRDASEDARFASIDFSNVDRVYILAWDVGGAKYLYKEDSQFQQLDWNLNILLNIMPQLKNVKVPFLFVSTQLAEDVGTVYGVTKRLGEVWTSLLGGVKVRLWNVYGAFEDLSERSHVVADFVCQAIEDGSIKMLTDGQELRQFVHISDVCEALHYALSNNLQGTYDITSFEWLSILEVANKISELTGAEVVIGSRKGSTPITPHSEMIPGWHPKIDFDRGLLEFVQKANKSQVIRRGSNE